jgi:transposase-like protein
MNNRKTYTSELKSRIVLEMFREELTVSQISSKYGVHQSVLNKWRNTALEGLPGLFADPRRKSPADTQKDNIYRGSLSTGREAFFAARMAQKKMWYRLYPSLKGEL